MAAITLITFTVIRRHRFSSETVLDVSLGEHFVLSKSDEFSIGTTEELLGRPIESTVVKKV